MSVTSRFFVRFIICLITGCLLAMPGGAPAFAQNDNILARPQFNFMAREALDMPDDFDFTGLRFYYSQTPQYDPLSTQATEWLLKFAYAAQMEADPEKQKKAFGDFALTVAAHLGNIDVVSQALSFSRQDMRFGDPEFFKWLRQGLLQSVLESGDGGSLLRAYDVVTMGEEAGLLNELNVDVLSSETVQEGNTYYNMHEVSDARHTGPYTIFVNTKIPMKWLEYQRESQKPDFNIPRQ
jgi:hypothetical protein